MNQVVKLRSWHIIGITGRTICGRRIPSDAPQGSELPSEEKSCESCLRLGWVPADQKKGVSE